MDNTACFDRYANERAQTGRPSESDPCLAEHLTSGEIGNTAHNHDALTVVFMFAALLRSVLLRSCSYTFSTLLRGLHSASDKINNARKNTRPVQENL